MARARSPGYPAIGLKEAIEKVQSIYKEDYQNKLARPVIAAHMGYKTLNGRALGVLSALSKFGLLEGRGDETGVSDLALQIIAHPSGSLERAAAIKDAAERPDLFEDIDKRFPDGKASDTAIKSYLMTQKFLPDAAEVAIRAYRETKKLVAEEVTAYSPPGGRQDKGEKAVSEVPPPAVEVKVGDYVQWTSGGVDQFKPVRPVAWVSEDGKHLRVHGSMTGIPMSEVAVTAAPKPPARGSSAYAGTDGELNVLLTGNRLEITANVDLAGLERLKEVLGHYEHILKLLTPEEKPN